MGLSICFIPCYQLHYFERAVLIRTSSSQNAFLHSFCSLWVSNVHLKELPSFDGSRFTVNASWPCVSVIIADRWHRKHPERELHYVVYLQLSNRPDSYVYVLFFFLSGPPVIVGMSINIASIDSISEVNMVSYALVHLTVIDDFHWHSRTPRHIWWNRLEPTPQWQISLSLRFLNYICSPRLTNIQVTNFRR